MENFVQIIFILAGAITVLYALLMALYCYGWVQTSEPALIPLNKKCRVSVIIAARNEEHNISACLNSLIQQTCFNEAIEIIIVDDHSTDATINEVQRFKELYKNIQLIGPDKNSFGKKQAIKAGISTAIGELIVTTDADCVMGKYWLQSIINCYNRTSAKMIVAPVCFDMEKTLFEKLQSLEFMALVTSGAGSLYYNKAIMCNGANLAYSKEVFNEVKGFEGIEAVASGDDVLLMYKIKQKYPEEVKFLKQKEAIVYTQAKPTIKEFIQQRKRWASKDWTLLNMETKFVSVLVYLTNLLIVFTFVVSFCLINSAVYLSFLKFGLIILGIKCIIDFLLLFLAGSFFNKKHFLIYFLPEQIIYIIYISVMGLFLFFRNYEWKGRKIKI